MLVVDQETEIPLTLTNPMFSEQGSHSLPFSVPNCLQNRICLGNIDLINIASPPVVELECSITTELFDDVGELNLTDFDSLRIELSFNTREGLFWKWAKKTMLNDIEFPEPVDIRVATLPVNQPYPTNIAAQFPVLANAQADYIALQKYFVAPFYGYNEDYPYSRILNNWDAANNKFVLWETRHSHYRKDFTPFLYMNAIIEFIFNTCGIKIIENDLTSVDELNRVCILNNAAYAYNNFFLQWDLLVPKIPIHDFLEAVRGKFNATFFIDYKNNSCRIKFNDSILSSTSIRNITGDISFKSLAKKSLAITHSTLGDELIDETPFTIEEIVETWSFDDTICLPPFDPDVDRIGIKNNDDDAPENAVEFFPSSQLITINRWIDSEDDETYKYWYKKFIIGALSNQLEGADENIIEFASKACLHSVRLTQVPTLFNEKNHLNEIVAHHFNNSYLFVAQFLTNLNDIDKRYTDSPQNFKPNEFPVVFSVYRGKIKATFNNMNPSEYSLPPEEDRYYPYGSCFPYDNEGVILSESENPNVYPDTLSLQTLGENGVKENFFRVTNEFINNSCYDLKIKHFNPKDFVNPDFNQLYTTNFVRYLLSKVEMIITPFHTTITEVEGLSLKPYVEVLAIEPDTLAVESYEFWTQSPSTGDLVMGEEGAFTLTKTGGISFFIGIKMNFSRPLEVGDKFRIDFGITDRSSLYNFSACTALFNDGPLNLDVIEGNTLITEEEGQEYPIYKYVILEITDYGKNVTDVVLGFQYLMTDSAWVQGLFKFTLL